MSKASDVTDEIVELLESAWEKTATSTDKWGLICRVLRSLMYVMGANCSLCRKYLKDVGPCAVNCKDAGCPLVDVAGPCVIGDFHMVASDFRGLLDKVMAFSIKVEQAETADGVRRCQNIQS